MSFYTHPKSTPYVVALDERGKEFSSPQFASKLKSVSDQGSKGVTFIIGGADGLDKTVLERADLISSLGQMTWPHKLCRVLLMEQLYRAQQILKGHPYHKF